MTSSLLIISCAECGSPMKTIFTHHYDKGSRAGGSVAKSLPGWRACLPCNRVIRYE